MALTALLLLIVGMVTEGSTSHHGLPVDLPRTATAVAQPQGLGEDTIKISVTPAGNVFFRREQIRPSDLPDRISSAAREGVEKEVYLAIESHTKYADVMPVLDQIRAAGITQVVVLVDRQAGH